MIEGRRGLSLIETVVALFLLIGEVIVLMGLFDRSLHLHARSVARNQACLVASRKMSEVRVWAQNPLNFASDWSAYNGTTSVDPDYPGYSVRTECRPSGQPLLSPCLSLESAQGANSMLLTRAVVSVRVRVDWHGAHQDMVSYIREPARTGPYTLTITKTAGADSPMGVNTTADFHAQLQDAAGEPIPCVRYAWAVLPLRGNATMTLAPNRTRQDCSIKHLFISRGREVHVSGDLKLRCQCTYHGQVVTGWTPVINLE